MKMVTYRVEAQYWINGHKNVGGMAIADEINKGLMDRGDTTDRRLVERELAGVDAALYGLKVAETEVEVDE